MERTWTLEMMRQATSGDREFTVWSIPIKSTNIPAKSRHSLPSFPMLLSMNMERKNRWTVHLIAVVSRCFSLRERPKSLFLLGTGSFKGLCSRNRASCPPHCMPSRLSSWASSCLWVSVSHTAVERLGLHMLAAIPSSTWAQGIQTQVLRLLASESFPYPEATFGPNAHLVQVLYTSRAQG